VRHDPAEVVLAQLARPPLPGDTTGELSVGGVVAETDEGGQVGLGGETETGRPRPMAAGRLWRGAAGQVRLGAAGHPRQAQVSVRYIRSTSCVLKPSRS
jgi:hypothetical protein